MKQKIVIKSFSYSCLILLLMALAIGQFQLASTQALPKLKISAQDSALNINHQLINTLHLGQRRLIASIIWIETLMNSDLEHYDPHDLNSWMYQRFNALIELDPKFYEVYRYGGQYLSIVKDDEVGAEDIYRRGLEVFPNSFWLNFHAGFHYYFEMNLAEKAILLFHKAVKMPEAKKYAPYLPSLLAKIEINKSEVTEESFLLVSDIRAQYQPGEPMWERLSRILYYIRCSIDLKCLNNKNNDCRNIDFNGLPYLFSAAKQRYESQNDCSLK